MKVTKIKCTTFKSSYLARFHGFFFKSFEKLTYKSTARVLGQARALTLVSSQSSSLSSGSARARLFWARKKIDLQKYCWT